MVVVLLYTRRPFVHVYKYLYVSNTFNVSMVIKYIAIVWINRVRLPILLVVGY